MAAEQWGPAHDLLMRHLAPAWALRGVQGWDALHASAAGLQDHQHAVDAACGPGAHARGAGLLSQLAHTQARPCSLLQRVCQAAAAAGATTAQCRSEGVPGAMPGSGQLCGSSLCTEGLVSPMCDVGAS